MLDNSTVWELFSWLWLGLAVWFLKAWFVGDLNLVSVYFYINSHFKLIFFITFYLQIWWMPRLRRTSLMMDYKILMYLWIIFDIVTVIAHWFIWKDNGKWSGDSIGPLIVGILYVLLIVVWFYIFNVLYRVRVSFWIATVAFAVCLATTIWFIILQTIPGILMIIVTVWNLYFWYWNWELCRRNTVGGNVDILGEGQVLVSDNANAIPCNDAFARAGRRSFLKFRSTSKFNQIPVVLGRNSDVVNRQDIYVPQSQFQGQWTGQQTQFQGQFVNEEFQPNSQSNIHF